MTETIQINGQDLSIKEFGGQRVATFRDIDRVHNRKEGTARKRFSDNKKRLIEGTDFYKICPSEIRTGNIMPISSKATTEITLPTESGYLMLVKSFTDDLAWEVQRQLVNTYFKAKVEMSKYPQKSTSAGEVSNLIKQLSKIMIAQRSSPYMMAKTIEMVLNQFGIELPPNFVEPAYEQVALITTVTQIKLQPIDGQQSMAIQ